MRALPTARPLAFQVGRSQGSCQNTEMGEAAAAISSQLDVYQMSRLGMPGVDLASLWQ